MADAQELYRQARSRMEAGSFEEAAALFHASAEHTPHFKAYELLRECLLRLGRPAEAVMPLAAATALNEQGRAPALLAEAFLAINEPEDAARFATLSLERSPNNRRATAILSAVGPLPDLSKRDDG